MNDIMITLDPMTQPEFEVYLEHLIKEYAAEHVKSGRWQADGAVDQSREEINQYFPDGLQTENQYLYTIRDSAGERVGILWFGIREQGNRRIAFIFDIEIDEAHRRRGYGSQTMGQLEKIATEMELNSIELHVFGHNLSARAMYQKLGFAETNVMMRKDI